MSNVDASDRVAIPPVRARQRSVLVVAPEPFYEDRGTPIAVRHVLEALAELGFEIHLLTFPVGEPVELDGLWTLRCSNPLGIRSVPVGFSLRKVVLDHALTALLWRRLRRGRYACIHAVEEMALPAIVMGRRAGIPVIYDMQSSLPEQLRDHPLLGLPPSQALLRRAETWMIRNADYVVSSTGLAERVLARSTSGRHRDWVFPGPEFVVKATAVDRLRRRLDISSGSFVVLYAGNFEEYQGVDLLLEAIPGVLRVRPDVVVLLVGAKERDDFRLPSRAGVPEEAIRVLERQPRDALAALYELADVLVSPRVVGSNIPLKVFDYLANGGVIVATDIAAHRTVLNHDRAVLVAPTPEGMADGILRVLEDPELADSVRASAEAFGDKHLSWDGFVESVRDVYLRVGAFD